MDIISEKEKIDWNRFVIAGGGSFLQSWRWGEVQKALGKKIWRIKSVNELQALVIKHDLPFGKSYLYCPGGPVIRSNIKKQIAKILDKFLEQVKEMTKQENAIFLKVEPMLLFSCHSEASEESRRISSPMRPFAKVYPEHGRRAQDDMMRAGFIVGAGIQNIEKTLILDLNKSEEELLAEMKQKTRYNIKVAQKHGLKIKISSQPAEDVRVFCRLSQETAQRNRFRIHPFRHYEKLLSVGYQDEVLELKKESGDQLKISLFLAECQEKIIAANIVVFFGKIATYLHGASSGEHSNLMAPYLLQWVQIQEAKKLGCEIYDFWGIDESKWAGVTRFKKGFGGSEVFHSGAYDYIFNEMWYRFYKLAKKFKL